MFFLEIKYKNIFILRRKKMIYSIIPYKLRYEYSVFTVYQIKNIDQCLKFSYFN